MLPQPIVSVHFDFYGQSFDPDIITQRLGIEPTGHFRAGDPMSLGTGRRRRDCWTLRVGDREALYVDDMLKELRAAFTAPPETVKKLCSELDVEAVATCMVVPQSRQMPAMDFPADFVVWAASLGARITVDVLTVSEDEDAE
jgi:hypothetical protein